MKIHNNNRDNSYFSLVQEKIFAKFPKVTAEHMTNFVMTNQITALTLLKQKDCSISHQSYKKGVVSKTEQSIEFSKKTHSNDCVVWAKVLMAKVY